MFDGAGNDVSIFMLNAITWPAFAARVAPHLEQMAAGSGGRYLADDIVAAAHTGRMQIWVIMDGASVICVGVTELVQYPRLLAMRCVGIVGHRPRRWMHLLANVEAVARDAWGCTRMEALHTPGHERLLRTGGWRQWHTLSEKSL